MKILHPVSILNFLSSSSCNFARTKHFFWIGQSQRELCRFFKMAAITSQIFFCFLVLGHLAFRKAKNYLRIKFRPNISIHGQVITTSGCSKQTSAIFKFYSKLRWTLHRHRHFVILHWPTKFLCKSDDRRRSYDVILILHDGGHSVANLLPVSDLATCDV